MYKKKVFRPFSQYFVTAPLAVIIALSFMGMTLQAWHTCIWGISLILLCRSSPALSGWMGSVAAQLFSGLSRDVQSGSREACFSWSESLLSAFWQTPTRLSCAFYWGVASVWPLYQKAWLKLEPFISLTNFKHLLSEQLTILCSCT